MRIRPRHVLVLIAGITALATLNGCSTLEANETEHHVMANIQEGDRQLTLGNDVQARVWYDRAVRIAPRSPATYLGPDGLSSGDMTGGLIGSLAQHNDWPDMETYLTKALQSPSFSSQWMMWSSLAAAQKQMGETQAARLSSQQQLAAMKSVKSDAAIAPGTDEFRIQYADALWNSGQQSPARDELLRLISHHPNDAAEPQNDLAYAEATDGVDLPEAEQLATTAVQSARQSSAADEELGAYLDTLGWAEYRQKEYGPALINLQEALDYIPREAVSHYHLAEIYQALGQTVPAQIEIERAATLAPSDFDTKAALLQIEPTAPQGASGAAPAKQAA